MSKLLISPRSTGSQLLKHSPNPIPSANLSSSFSKACTNLTDSWYSQALRFILITIPAVATINLELVKSPVIYMA
jgi:hypothetical protein